MLRGGDFRRLDLAFCGCFWRHRFRRLQRRQFRHCGGWIGQGGGQVVRRGALRFVRGGRCRFGRRVHPRQTPGPLDRILIAVHFLAGGQQAFGQHGRPEPRLRAEFSCLWNGDERQRVQPVGRGKGFRLGQGFAGHHGHLNAGSLAPPVKHKLVHRVGGLAFQFAADLGATACCIRPCGGQGHIADLGIRDHQLCGHAARLKPKRRSAQIGQRPLHLRIVNRNASDFHPAPRRAVQECDGVIGKGKGKTWLHDISLAQFAARRRVRGVQCLLAKAAFCQMKEKHRMAGEKAQARVENVAV